MEVRAHDLRREALAVAQELGRSSSYGPWGGRTLVANGDAQVLASAASVLREVRPGSPAVRPYAALVAAVQGQAGDGASTALLLAARMVKKAVEQEAVPLPVWREGMDLARRQVDAVLASLRQEAPLERTLAHVAPLDAGVVVGGLQNWRGPGALPLDQVDIRAEPRDDVVWLDGLVVAPRHPVREVTASGVLVCEEPLRLRPRREAGIRLERPEDLGAWQGWESSARQEVLDRLEHLGVGLLVVPGALDEELAGRLASRGVLVVADAPRDLRARLALATGCRPVLRPEAAEEGDVGRTRFERRSRRDGWRVQGDGPGATLVVPAQGVLAPLLVDHAERLLRAAGHMMERPGALPGGGRWQREVASALRRAADLAPGKAPIVLRAVAEAFGSLADDLVRSFGHDPLERSLPPGAEDVLDPEAVVRDAVSGAFETAGLVLRLDGRLEKTPSTMQGLRGGTGPVGSPRGMPGDIPPLM